MILTGVSTGGVQKEDVLRAVAGRFIENFAAAPSRGVDPDVTTNDGVILFFVLVCIFID